MSIGNERLLNIKEASEVLGVKVGTLYNWVSRQRIKYVKVGRLVRFSHGIIDEFIRNNTVQKTLND